MSFYKEILQPIREAICNYPNRPAFFIQDKAYTYRQFAERVSAIRGVIRHADAENQCGEKRPKEIWNCNAF